ncbi:hypothetical protein KBD45_07685 [Candidatus Dojkabacteria bacterium]|nr:hypothetical protein [Candidatus Dojkabacteria bacterium]
MERKTDNNGLLNDGDDLSFENMMKLWEEADKFDTDGYCDLSFALKSEFFNRLALVKDRTLLEKVDAIIHPWKYKK